MTSFGKKLSRNYVNSCETLVSGRFGLEIVIRGFNCEKKWCHRISNFKTKRNRRLGSP
jgi:hypothetical protein